MELLSEEEQWERLKAWLREFIPVFLVVLVVGFSGWYGLKWWKGREEQQAVAADNVYQKVLAAYDEGRIAEGNSLIDTLRSQYPESAYVFAADMIAAKVHIEHNELDKAAERLERVANESPDKAMRPLARLRLARVQLALGEQDKALATLGTADMGPFQAGYLEVRGDVLLAKQDFKGALAAYEDALKAQPGSTGNEGSVAELLKLKIADLQGFVPAEAAPASEPETK